MLLPFDIKFIRLDQKYVGLASCSWSHLINLISKDTNAVFLRIGSDTVCIFVIDQVAKSRRAKFRTLTTSDVNIYIRRHPPLNNPLEKLTIILHCHSN